MNFVHEQDTGHNLCLALFTPLGHLVVYLLAYFRFDFSRITGEQREKALRPAIDHVDLVQRDSVNDFLPFLQFTFGTLNEFRLNDIHP